MKTWSRRLSVILLVAILGATLAACGPAKPSGEELLINRCQHCHTPTLATSVIMSRDEWGITIDRMIARGAVLDASEREILIDYLVKRKP